MAMDPTAILLVIILSAAFGYVVRGVHAAYQEMRRNIDALRQAQAKRLPYHSAEEIENAAAALNAIQFDLELKRELVENALAHIRKARGKE